MPNIFNYKNIILLAETDALLIGAGLSGCRGHPIRDSLQPYRWGSHVRCLNTIE